MAIEVGTEISPGGIAGVITSVKGYFAHDSDVKIRNGSRKEYFFDNRDKGNIYQDGMTPKN